MGAVMDLHAVATELIPERRANPGDDLLTWMVQAEFDGKKMTDDELRAFFVLMGVAANDTTRHASAHAIAALSKFPDQRALLVEDVAGRVDSAVEEVLRWGSPLLHMRRTATRDITVRGSEIKAGDKVVLWYYSGNRDEDVFEDPHTFNILRNPNPHIAFGGGGPHYLSGCGTGPHHAADVADRGVHADSGHLGARASLRARQLHQRYQQPARHLDPRTRLTRKGIRTS